MIHEVRVTTSHGPDVDGEALLTEIKHLGIQTITGVRTARVYRLEGVTESDARQLAEALFAERITHEYQLNAPILRALCVVEVAYKPGVMNPEAASIMKAARDLSVTPLIAVDSSIEYGFVGEARTEDIETIISRLLVNKTVQRVVVRKPETLVVSGTPGPIETISMRHMDDTSLVELSKQRELHLNLEEMRVIRAYFRDLGRDPTDGELETLAQTWSEHCVHKTFRASLVIDGVKKVPLIARLRETAAQYDRLVISSFADNSGVVEFYDGWGVCGKVETHNSPSAIEPYGGAATGSGGVFRDIMGTGQGAKLILSTDMFCFAPPDLPDDLLPPGCLHPRYLLRHVVRGVKDYGNRMGIPTANGSIHFHPDFRAKPTIIVGAYGLIPTDRAVKGAPQPGDAIIAVGGRTGRDGIHGATFSSGEMTSNTISVNSSAVQIGNAIEEKRMADALLVCRDCGLIRAVTDCGAGGFSSAIGEMGKETGARVYLGRAPLKYPGLAPWEIWVSESQERMVAAVAPENVATFLAICSSFDVEATVLGEFTADERLTVTYDNESLIELTMEFLHDGLPQRTMVGTSRILDISESQPDPPVDWGKVFCDVLAHPSIASKEAIVRLYDHGVQGGTVLYPFSGIHDEGPNDAVVLQPLPEKPYGLVVSHGLHPELMCLDPYRGGIWAATEALANLVAVGGNPDETALIDNFIWSFPDKESLAALDGAVDACVDVMHWFRIPFVSGKDSLSSTYRYPDGTVLKIPPVLCISAFGRIPDVRRTITADFKKPNSFIVLIGELQQEAMGGSVYYATRGASSCRMPSVDLAEVPEQFRTLHELIADGNILSCHDVSEGGVAVAIAEMCFGGGFGADLQLQDFGMRLDNTLFNEMTGCFIVEVDGEEHLSSILGSGICMTVLGRTSVTPSFTVRFGDAEIFSVATERLKCSWQQPITEVFA